MKIDDDSLELLVTKSFKITDDGIFRARGYYLGSDAVTQAPIAAAVFNELLRQEYEKAAKATQPVACSCDRCTAQVNRS